MIHRSSPDCVAQGGLADASWTCKGPAILEDDPVRLRIVDIFTLEQRTVCPWRTIGIHAEIRCVRRGHELTTYRLNGALESSLMQHAALCTRPANGLAARM